MGTRSVHWHFFKFPSESLACLDRHDFGIDFNMFYFSRIRTQWFNRTHNFKTNWSTQVIFIEIPRQLAFCRFASCNILPRYIPLCWITNRRMEPDDFFRNSHCCNFLQLPFRSLCARWHPDQIGNNRLVNHGHFLDVALVRSNIRSDT